MRMKESEDLDASMDGLNTSTDNLDAMDTIIMLLGKLKLSDDCVSSGEINELGIPARTYRRRVPESILFGDNRFRRRGTQIVHYRPNYGFRLPSAVHRRHRNRRRVIQRGSPQDQDEFTPMEDRTLRFTDLPEDVTLDILEFCDLKGLRALTATSSSMNDFVFPILLAKSGLILPDHSLTQSASFGSLFISNPKQATALSVWKRQKSFHSVDRLDIVLRLTVEQTDSLVDRIFSFFQLPMPHSAPFATAINVYVSSRGELTDAACRLISGLVRSMCSELRIIDCKEYRSYPLSVMSNLSRPTKPATRGFEGLELFHARCPFLLSPRMLSFTVQHLITSNLTDLDLSMVRFSAGRWTALLRDLSFSRLENLNLGGSVTVFASLNFLSRHNTLKQFSLFEVSVPFSEPKLSVAFSLSLPVLEYIRAPCLYLSEILRHIEQSSNLTRVAILTDYDIPFTIGCRAGFTRISVISLFRQMEKFQSVSKVEFYFSRLGTMEFCDTSQDKIYGWVPPEKALSSVETVSFYDTVGRPFDNEALTKAIDWIMLFPRIFTMEIWEPCREDRSGWKSTLRSNGIMPLVHESLHFFLPF